MATAKKRSSKKTAAKTAKKSAKKSAAKTVRTGTVPTGTGRGGPAARRASLNTPFTTPAKKGAARRDARVATAKKATAKKAAAAKRVLTPGAGSQRNSNRRSAERGAMRRMEQIRRVVATEMKKRGMDPKNAADRTRFMQTKVGKSFANVGVQGRRGGGASGTKTGRTWNDRLAFAARLRSRGH